jgi:hypothetical protein
MSDDPAAFNPASPSEPNQRNIVSIILGVLLFVAAAAAALFIFVPRHTDAVPDAATQEAPDYLANIKLADIHLSAEANFLNQQVTYLDGSVTNAGQKTVRQLKVRLFFRDVMERVILKEDHDMLAAQQPLAPGQTRTFQIRFDRIPESWNRQVPYLQLISLRVQQ